MFYTVVANWSATPVLDVVVGMAMIDSASKGTTTILAACSFSLIIFSISISICFNCALYSMTSFIKSSFCVSISSMSLVRGSSVVGNFDYFLIASMSIFFFLTRSSAILMFAGSWPALISKSSKSLILVSLASVDTFSIFNCDWTLANVTYNLGKLIVVLVIVEKLICPVFLCISIWSMECMYFT